MGTHKFAWLGVLGMLLTMYCQDAVSGNLDVVINGRSHHLHSKYDWNENNIGLGFEYELSSSSRWIKTVTANTFEDSLENLTYMAGVGLKRRLLMTDHFAGAYLDAGVVVFLMSRKYINDYRPFPGILPAVTVGNRYAGVNLTYLPRRAVRDMTNADIVDPTIGGVFFMQFKFRLPAFGQ